MIGIKLDIDEEQADDIAVAALLSYSKIMEDEEKSSGLEPAEQELLLAIYKVIGYFARRQE